MTVWIDPPVWPAHGTVFAHVVSDTSVDELHEVARRAGVPRRAFDGDHYDVAAERYDDLVRAGAVPTSGADLARRLIASGLRLRKRKGDHGLARLLAQPTPLGVADLDVVASRRPLAGITHRALLTPAPGSWGVPFSDAGADARPQEPVVGWLRITPVAEADRSPSGPGPDVALVQVHGHAEPAEALPSPWCWFATAG